VRFTEQETHGLQREVAVKILPARLSSDPARLERFEREAHSASALNHPYLRALRDRPLSRVQGENTGAEKPKK